MKSRVQLALGTQTEDPMPFVRRVRRAFHEPPRGVDVLAAWIDADAVRRSAPLQGPIRKWSFPEPRMSPPIPPLADVDVPGWPTLGALATGLSLRVEELDWYCDRGDRNRKQANERLRHYHCRWLSKRAGGQRLIENPKPRLKSIQRVIAQRVLVSVPVDEAAYGFVRGRSALDFARIHEGQPLVVRLDLEDFFSSIHHGRVRALFASLGYPHNVAAALAALCTVATPEDVLRMHRDPDPRMRYVAAQRLRARHLPQGAPSSPALSNLVAFRLDRRLSGLARAVNLRYARYADDLAFSGDDRPTGAIDRSVVRVGAIVEEEGFRLRYRKLRVMRCGGRQRLAGLVVNTRPNVSRHDYDALRALLHNAARLGPASQNLESHPDFRAHLIGRIGYVAQTHAARGAQLQSAFGRIAWPPAADSSDAP